MIQRDFATDFPLPGPSVPWAESSPIVIENVKPRLDCGRYTVKRVVGDVLQVEADIFNHGHDVLAAELVCRRADQAVVAASPMKPLDNDRWQGSFTLGENARYCYTIEAYVDAYETWRQEFARKVEAGFDVSSEIEEGRLLLSGVAGPADGRDIDGRDLDVIAGALRGMSAGSNEALAVAQDGVVAEIMRLRGPRKLRSRHSHELVVVVDRQRAEFGAWYEMFPRSQGRVAGRSATFDDCIARLPEIAAMGFDVVYLTPIHPVGRTNRKGPNNSLSAGPDDPGSTYAIGNEHGGHKAVEPALGTLADFERFVLKAGELGLEVALDFAIQCSPDHPYVREHPEWFCHRPDGSIKVAENPPKRYEDIYPLDLLCDDYRALWEELKSVVLFWVQRGVKIFRVDNPHTKPVAFWEWLICEVQRAHPEVVFLAEAFTRPKMMKSLAKAGFTQSYTYFTWRNGKAELTDYFTELTQSEMAEYFRPNLFTNTPDILPFHLQDAGPATFKIRLVLAATLSSSYGIYNGYELCENKGLPGKEEYRDSEKYEYKVWDWDRPGNIKEFIARVNEIRQENQSLHRYRNLRFYWTDNDNIIAYGKANGDRSNIVIVAVNLDAHRAQESTLSLPIGEFGIEPWEQYTAHDLLTGARYSWHGDRQYIRLDPSQQPAHIFRIERNSG